MNSTDEWEVFQVVADVPSAVALCGQLESGGCPAKYQASALESGVEGDYCVLVPGWLAHRARWIIAQDSLSSRELEYLATGELPGKSDDRGA